jgi:stage II sporulation protein D
VDSAVDTDADGYETNTRFTVNEVRKILSSAGILNKTEPKEWFSAPKLNSAGSVKTIDVCGKTLTGVEVRKLFSLRSTSFTVTLNDTHFDFTVHGYGHQVGMSQNGANALAQQGKSYTEILTHYYQGVDIQNYKF